MLISQILAWISVLLCVMETLRFAARKSRKPTPNRFFHQIHIPFGLLLLLTATAHLLLAGNAKGAQLRIAPAIVPLNWGFFAYVCALLLGITYLLRRKLKKAWIAAHRILAVIMLLALTLHCLEMGISLPNTLFSGKKDPRQENLPDTRNSPDSLPEASPGNSQDMRNSSDSLPEALPEISNSPDNLPETQQLPAESAAASLPSDADTFSSNTTTPSSGLQEPETGLPGYRDGTYEGSGKGRNGVITVRVTVTQGKIAAVDVINQTETPRYYALAKSVIPEILSQQTVEVDAVSGATITSEGIKAAVLSALGQAGR